MPLLEFVIPGPPVPYQTSDKKNLKAWQAIVRTEAAKHWTGVPLAGKLKFLLINFHEGDKPSLDDDNMVKPIRDALNRLVYDDDRQIRYSETVHLSIDAPMRIRKASRSFWTAFVKGMNSSTCGSRTPPMSFNFRRDAMDREKELESLAARYAAEGYQVATHPNADHVPSFAKGFDVDLVATRGNERVLVQAKWDRSALEADPRALELADLASKQPGWRYDVVILNESDPLRRMTRGSREPTQDEIGQLADRAEAVADAGHAGAACVLGWAALEAAMRRLSRDDALFMPKYVPAELLRTLYGNGILSREDFDQLTQSYRLRSELVHGFVPPAIDPQLVRAPIRAARHLLAVDRDGHAVGA